MFWNYKEKSFLFQFDEELKDSLVEVEDKLGYELMAKCDNEGGTLENNSSNFPIYKKPSLEYKQNELRNRREYECFPIINRGDLWYNKLNESQLKELSTWYDAWLNITETLQEPDKPGWLK